jgi:hypothetical protein
MAVAIDVKGKSNESINISHSTINIIMVNIMEYSLNIDEIASRIFNELQQRALYDPKALEVLNKVQQLVEELKKTNSRERKLSLLKKILEIAAPLVDLLKILAGMLRH